ncbi:MAG: transcriptional regulator [Oscillatoriales cyanobacterium SM2_1_8]|nr:transcriptional regulator [Oscillatoriales cyanobacterium SM2_1_8]
MDDQELANLLKDLESDRVERKACLSSEAKTKIRQAICALANDLPNHGKPGIVFLGVNDDGTCANLPITDELLLNLANIRSEGKILPFPVLRIGKYHLDGCELAVVLVEPADAPPLRLDGRTYVRVGPTSVVASAEEERRLSEKRRFKDLPFDIRPLAVASLDDLDLNTFQREYLTSALAPEVLAENQRSLNDQLIALRFLTPEPNSCPTHLGILVVGKEPRQFVPGFYIQFVRFDGRELASSIRDQKEIGGSLANLLRYTDEVLQANIATATNIETGSVEIKHPDYPIVALRQLVRNAVMHRSYEGTYAPVRIYWFEDRIEIQSPGGLFGQVNRENFGRGAVIDYRNPHLAEAMKNLGYVQRFGIGIPIAQQELEKNGNPPAEFLLENTYTWAVVRRRA